jgi:hypothetical protein
MTVFRGMKVSEPVRQLSWVVTLVTVPKSQSFSRNIIKRPYSSEIPNRFLKHDFRAENPDELWESRSIGRGRAKWHESQLIYPTFFETSTALIGPSDR